MAPRKSVWVGVRVVSDTSPLNYLILIDAVSILEPLYSRITIPQGVFAELSHDRAPGAVRSWVAKAPSWLEIQTAPEMSDNRFALLDQGEREAVALAFAKPVSRILIDDLRGRRLAEQLGLEMVGTIGVLRQGARQGLVDLLDAIVRLKSERFRISDQLVNELLDPRSAHETSQE